MAKPFVVVKSLPIVVGVGEFPSLKVSYDSDDAHHQVLQLEDNGSTGESGFIRPHDTDGADESIFVTTGVTLRLGSSDTAGGQSNFVSLPSRCDEPATSDLGVVALSKRSVSGRDRFSTTNCAGSKFDPVVDEFDPQISSVADTPIPYRLAMSVPPDKSIGSNAHSAVAGMNVSLTKGVRLNPLVLGRATPCDEAVEFQPSKQTVQSSCPQKSLIGSFRFSSEETPDIVGPIYLGESVKLDDQSLRYRAKVFFESHSGRSIGFGYKVVGYLNVSKGSDVTVELGGDTPVRAMPQIRWDTFAIEFHGPLLGTVSPPWFVSPAACVRDGQSGKVTFFPWSAAPMLSSRSSSSFLLVDTTDSLPEACASTRSFAPSISQVDAGNETVSAKYDKFHVRLSQPQFDVKSKRFGIQYPAGVKVAPLNTIGVPCSGEKMKDGRCPSDSVLGQIQAQVGFGGTREQLLSVSGKVLMVSPVDANTARVALVFDTDLLKRNDTLTMPSPFAKMVVPADLTFDSTLSRLQLQTTGDISQVLLDVKGNTTGIPAPLRTLGVTLGRVDGEWFQNPVNTNPRSMNLSAVAVDGRTTTFSYPWQAKPPSDF